MSDKIYVGNGKVKSFDWGSVLNATLDLDALVLQYGAHGFANQKGDRKIKVTVMKRKEPDDYGNTHYITLDTWHPDNYKRPQSVKLVEGEEIPEAPKSGYDYSDEDIPF